MKNGVYTLRELSACYFPNNHPRSASVQLKGWINNNSKLKAELEEAGYAKGQRYLTPRQTELIFAYIGEP